MLPGNIRHLCEQLLAVRVVDAQNRVTLREPPLEKRIALFLSALELLREHTGHPWYGLYVCTVLGYRRLVVCDGACLQVDNRIIDLLRAHPEIIPSNCYVDRLPPQALLLLERVRLLRRIFFESRPSVAYLERMAAD